MLIFPTRRRREERVISLGRVLLTGFSALALAFPFATNLLPPPWLIQLLHLYFGLAVAYALIVWIAQRLPLWLRPATHILDLAFFCALAFAREGTASPLFVFVVFALVTATVRWQWHGIAWTGGLALAIYVAAGAWAIWVVEDPYFETLRFAIRVTCLVVLILVLSFLGRHYRARQDEMAGLSRWPHSIPERLGQLVEQVLPHVARVLGGRKTLLLWREDGRTESQLWQWRAGEAMVNHQVSVTPRKAVRAELDGVVFLWSSKHGTDMALFESSERTRSITGALLDPGLAAELGSAHAVVMPISATGGDGLLIATSESAAHPDRLGLGRLIGQMLGAQIDQLALHRGLRREALDRQRIRIARDVHDGVAQSLAVVGLRLRSASSAVDGAPAEAKRLVSEAAELLSTSQRELRGLTEELRGGGESRPLGDRAQAIARQVERSYGIAVDFDCSLARQVIPPGLTSEAAHLIQEAATNAARHAGAAGIRIELGASESELRLRVEDDGHGLTFDGRRDLAELLARQDGPRMIRERVRDLSGSLTIDSSSAGTILDIALPLAETEL